VYLISVEGGDGSGKGEAARILAELLSEYPFPDVISTHEPRRQSELGKLALSAVKHGKKTPLEEAGLFAADRLDHSHTFILPHLEQGSVVVSDRNVHSSLIYQGVVGELGIDQVVKMNAAAMIPDIVFWIDCDPEKAMKRIQTGTLRMTSGKQEYFETTEIQKKIRQGFHELLSGEIRVPAPFDKCQIVGPILNEGGLDELKSNLREELRRFFNKRSEPLNVSSDEVDRVLLSKLVESVQLQRRLPGAPMEKTEIHTDWLSGQSPSWWFDHAESRWNSESAKENDVPATPFAHSCWSVLGTLSLMGGSCEIPRLYTSFGPSRMVTKRHTQRLVKWLVEENWIHKQQSHVPFVDAQVFKLRDDTVGYSRLTLALWPARQLFSGWRRANPESDWSVAFESIFGTSTSDLPPSQQKMIQQISMRLEILTSGHTGCPVPKNVEEMNVWWSMEPPSL
jgi:dTMP kinase